MRSFILCVLVLASQAAAGQSPNFNEFFKQKKTQIRYLVAQIAALQVYLEKLKDGYEIVDRGLTTIGNIKDGKFSMDKAYLESLRAVHPAIAGSPLLEQTASYNAGAIEILRDLYEHVGDSENFIESEQEYVQQVREVVVSEVSARTEELTWLIRPGGSEMTDDERLSHLENLAQQCQHAFLFSKRFDRDMRALGRQRAKERQAIEVLRKLHGLN